MWKSQIRWQFLCYLYQKMHMHDAPHSFFVFLYCTTNLYVCLTYFNPKQTAIGVPVGSPTSPAAEGPGKTFFFFGY